MYRTLLTVFFAMATGCALAVEDDPPPQLTVELRSATIPGALEPIGCHCWYVTHDSRTGERHRWEVRHEQGMGGQSWGYVHRDSRKPDDDIGGGPYRIERVWTGEEARRLVAALQRSPEYPHRDEYRYWPGPNSNTYAAWVLKESGVQGELPPTAVGKDYTPLASAGVTPSGTGVQLDTAPAGLKIGAREGVEAHVLGLTFGVQVWPPAIELPFGRIGPGE